MKGGGIRHIMADLLVKVIDDFRHLLALIVMLVFALTLGYALVTASTVEQVSGLLQAVTSAFGGIVGAIIGYYFGESAAKASSPGPDEPTVIVDGGEQAEPPAGDQAGPAGTGADGIRRAPPPPGSG
jgi:hypothetical protein